MKACQSILILLSCQLLHTLALECNKVDAALDQIDAGLGMVVGVDYQNEVFFLVDNTFTKIPGSLKHISVGPAGLVGVNSDSELFRYQNGKFTKMKGESYKQVDAGGDEILARVKSNDDVYCLNKDDTYKPMIIESDWKHLQGKLKYYSCGPDTCWGVNSIGRIYIRKGVSRDNCGGSDNFEKVDGSLSMIEVATDGSVYGVNSNGQLYHRLGITASNPAGSNWSQIIACSSGHKHVTYDLGILWAICNDGSIQRCIWESIESCT